MSLPANVLAPVRVLRVLLAAAILAAGPASAQLSGINEEPDGSRTADRSVAQAPTRAAAAAQTTTTDEPLVQRYRPDVLNLPVRAPSDTVGGEDRSTRTKAATPSEFEAFVSEVVDKPLRRFGSELLVPAARGFTTPPTTTVPSDYRINPGDEIVIGLTGSVEANDLRLIVDNEGRIFVPRVGAVAVGGVRYIDLDRIVSSAVGRQYRSFHISVSVGRLHGITVFVTGYAAVPGSYTVSSLSTLVDAVLAAGGPAAAGSFRAIDVLRNNRLVTRFDLYDLLLKGDKSRDIVLQNADVIHINAAGAEVGVIGSVNNEAIFEARADETLGDVLREAGGPNTVADDSRILLLDSLRTDGSGWQELAPADADRRPARRGAIVRVLSGLGIARPQRDQSVLVTISGEVAKPGRLFVAPGTTLGDLLGRVGGLTPQAYPFATLITRESVRVQQRFSFDRAIRDLQFMLTARPLISQSLVQIQPARLQAVASVVAQLEMRRPDGRLVIDIRPEATVLPGGLLLENNDTIYVPPQPKTVGVFGTVPNPASFEFVSGRTIGQYLAIAGGPQKFGDRKAVFVIRANGTLLAPTHDHGIRAVLATAALPGDVVFVPIDATRGEFWERLQALTGTLVGGAVLGGSIAAIAR